MPTGSIDFSLPPDVAALQAEAVAFAADAVDRYGVHDDAWINGHSRELSRELAERGWIGMTWPVSDNSPVMANPRLIGVSSASE